MAMSMTGCLLPQDDQLMPDFPILKNNAPRFLADTAVPQQFTTVFTGASCLSQEFRIGVIDPDEGDLIRVRCFLDPNLSSGSEVVIEGKLVTPSSPGDAKFAKCSFNLSVGTGLARPGQHIVKMMIADGEFLINPVTNQPEPQPRPIPALDGGTLLLPTYSASHLWIPTSESKPCPLSDGGS